MDNVLETYRDDPVGFVQDVLGDPKPYAKQRELLCTLAAKRRVSVVGANGSGKDWAAARAILWWLATRRRAIVVVTGPTQRQVEQIVWRELRAAYKASRVPLGGRLSGSQWNIADDRYAIGFSTNRADNLQGFHSPELLVVVTEAHAMPQDQMEALKRLFPARMLLTGNAFSRDGEFFDSHHTKRHIYACVAVSVYDTPNFTGENGGAPGMPTDEDIEERKLDWGEDHPLYQGSVLGRFPDALDDSLIARSAIDQAVARWESLVPSPSTGEGEDRGEGPPAEEDVEGGGIPPRPPGEGNARQRGGEGGPSAEDRGGVSVVPAEAGTPQPLGEGAPSPGAPDAGHSPRHSRTGGNPECTGSAHGAGQGAGSDSLERGERDLAATLDSPGPPDAGHNPRHSRTGGNPECTGSAHGAGQWAGSDCLERREISQPLPPSTDPRLGVDVARFGSDKTALCVRRGWVVESLRSFSRVDTMRTAGEAAALVRDLDVPAVFVDEGGLGAGVVDRLRELGAPVHGVQFGGKARQSGRFANMRAEIFWELRRLFRDGLIAIPRDEELISQLLGLRYDVTSAGQVKMESKTSLRRRGLRSPDKADALALAFMEPPSLQIWTGPPLPAEAGTSHPGYAVVPADRAPRPVRDSTDPASDAPNYGVW